MIIRGDIYWRPRHYQQTLDINRTSEDSSYGSSDNISNYALFNPFTAWICTSIDDAFLSIKSIIEAVNLLTEAFLQNLWV